MDSAQSLESLLPSSDLPKRFTQLGFASPLPVQTRALEALLKKENVAITGDAGTGKTVGYALYCAAAAQQSPATRSLVITPSEDQASEVVAILDKLGVSAALIGGSSSDASVLVAPLGEAMHSLRQKSPKDMGIGIIVLDNIVDPALPAVLADVEALLNELQSSVAGLQIVLVSRSLNFGAASVIRRLAGNPIEVNASQSHGAPVEHIYYETEGDLLSKPNTLGDIVELEADSSFLIFCNSPSDADFVEVILRKRGVNAHKLIGNAPTFRVNKAMQDIRSGEARALVVTDIAARSFEVELFNIVLNYSVPTDPEVYLHRIGNAGKSGSIRKVMSLVAPLDLANFHYVQKFVDFQFEARKTPSATEISGLQIKKMEKAAMQANASSDPKVAAMLPQIMASEQRDAIIAHLLQLSLTRPAAQGARDGREDRRGGGYGQDERRGGGDRGGYHEEREGREGREGGRDRGDGRRQRRGGRDRDGDDSGDNFGRRGDRGERGDRGDRGDRGERGDRDFSRGAPPPKLCRFYIGRGASQGFSEQELRSALSGNESIPADAVKRLNVRENYSFADVPEEFEKPVTEALSAFEASKEKKLFAVKATLIPEPREQNEGAGDEGSSINQMESENSSEGAVEAEA